MARDEGNRWYDRLLLVDRRWIYAILAVAVILPTVYTIDIPTPISSEVQAVYDFVEEMQPGEILFVAIDFDPSTLAELQPMTIAIIEQAFRREGRVLITALSQFGPAMAEDIIEDVATRSNKVRGVDYTFLGYKPYPGLTILAMGSDFRVPFPTDYYGTPIDQIPMMRGVRNYSNVKGVISMAAGSVAEMWITYGNARYGVPVALGVTGVMATDYYPYLQSGQLFGLIPGVKGAAEYEQLVGIRGLGSRGMPYQVTTHFVILAFMVITNIGFVVQRRARRRAGMSTR